MGAELVYGIGALILLGGLIWGVSHYRLKSRRAEAVSEEAVREEYKDPEHYDEARRAELEAQAENAEERAEQREDDKTG